MNDTNQHLASRIRRLEKEVENLKTLLTKQPAKPWWEQIVGEFKGDKMFAEIVREGRKIRRADRGRKR
jgi:hypothetical protein